MRPTRLTLTASVTVLAVAAWMPASAAVDAGAAAATRFTGAGGTAGGGDVSGDGRPDLVLANGTADPFGRRDAGAIYVSTGARSRAVDVRGSSFTGFRIAGAGSRHNLAAACVAGDMTGDGLADLVVGAQAADTANGEASGAAYVVFGSEDPSDVDLEDFHAETQEDRGFRIDGSGTFALAGWQVACLGDVNLDGLSDVAVAAPFAATTYVVFGKADTSPVDLRRFDLNAQGNAGFRIVTPTPDANSSYAVGAAGDTNGDGRPDVVVGVVEDVYDSPGTAFIIYGKADPLPVDVREAGSWGYEVSGASEGDSTGEAVSGAGDVNGDGLADVVIGAHRLHRGLPGKAYVVFGSASGGDVQLADLGDRGFAMVGGPGRDRAGSGVSGAGDVNGDGRADVLVGAPYADAGTGSGSGAVYVVFGQTDSATVRLPRMRGRGYRIVGTRRNEQIGSSVSSFTDKRGRISILAGSWRERVAYVVPAP